MLLELLTRQLVQSRPSNVRSVEQLKSGNDANFSELDPLGRRSRFLSLSSSSFRSLYEYSYSDLFFFAFCASHIKRHPRVLGHNFAKNCGEKKRKKIEFYEAIRKR